MSAHRAMMALIRRPAFIRGMASVRGLAFGAAGALLGVTLGFGRPQFTDLRTIAPIHGDPRAGAQKATVCLACHGADGISVAPTFPRLAGQRVDYLYHRLMSFKHADPKDPYYSVSPMTAMAAPLSDVDMRDIASYFAGQTPRPPDATAATAAPQRGAGAQIGEKLFLAGDPARGIPPCQGCHGADANGPSVSAGQYAAYPSLRGQYAPYVTARLSNFRSGHPADTSNAFIMHGIAETLDDDSIQAIAGWLNSLQPSKSP